MFLYFASICRRPFPMLHRQFSELVDSVSDQITSYHDNVLCTVILQDAHSHNWTENRPFFEVRQMFVTTFLVKSEWKCKKNVRLKFNVWRVFGQYYTFAVEDTYLDFWWVNNLSPTKLRKWWADFSPSITIVHSPVKGIDAIFYCYENESFEDSVRRNFPCVLH